MLCGACAVDYRITFRNATATSTDDWRARDHIFTAGCNVNVKEQGKTRKEEVFREGIERWQSNMQ